MSKDCSKKNNPNKIQLGGRQGNSSKKYRRAVGRLYAMGDELETPADSEPLGNVISGVLKVCNQLAYVLFDTGADYSFISHRFLQKLKSPPSFEKVNLKVGISDGLQFSCNKLYKNRSIEISSKILFADLVGFELGEFDVIFV